MRNLVVVREGWGQVEWIVEDGADISGQKDEVLALATDQDTGGTYFATRDGLLYERDARGKTTLLVSLTTFSEDGSPPFLEQGAEIVALEWLPEHEALAVASLHGDLLLVHRSPVEVEAVGMLEGGVAGMAWGPDGEVVAIATGAGKLLLMTKDWDVLAEVELESPTMESHVANGPSGVERVSISWRGDGKYLATNVGGSIVVWERDGCVLHARAEKVPGLHSHVAWQPRAALIAAVQPGQDFTHPKVVLFERNGLRKGGFELETVPGDTMVRGLQWNASSELLGIALEWGDTVAVQIWFRLNYHWYLKREWRRSRTRVGSLNFAWDPEQPLRLQLWTARGAHSHLDLAWQSAVTIENCTALVIDGPRVRITPLLETIIPPPLCAAAVEFPAPVQAACLGSDESGFGEVLAVVLSDGTIGLAHCERKGRWEDLDGEQEGEYGEPILKGEVVKGVSVSGRLVFWGREPLTLLALEREESGRESASVLTSFRFVRQSEAGSDACLRSRGQYAVQSSESHPVGGNLVSFWPAPNAEADLVLLEGGKLQWWGLGQPPRPCLTLEKGNSSRIEAVKVGSVCHVIALMSGKLYLSANCVATGVTSVVVRNSGANQGDGDGSAYVIWTTQKDELYIAELGMTSLEKQRAMPLNERGAVLLAALGEEAGVMIQTPRGNLETLYPRELVLATAANPLRRKDYAQALEVCRRHRLDLNLIVDFGGWERFVEDAPAFVRAVGSPARVAELVTSLHEGDVTREAYKGLLPPWNENSAEDNPETTDMGVARVSPSKEGGPGKVTSVCTAIREALRGAGEGIQSGAVGLCVLATHARSQPPQLEEALRILKEMRRAELQKDPNTALAGRTVAERAEDADEEGAPLISDTAPLTADRAMQHLIWLCGDANALYDVALGMYDLELAAMVAAQAQMDPKEFLPYLQSLASLSPALRKYTVDRKLGRWESALRNLAQAGDEHLPTALAILSEHPDLYPSAVNSIFVSQIPLRNTILEAWGDHLLRGEAFEQAAMAFLAGGHSERALAAYRHGGAWRAMFCVAGRLGYNVSATQELARQVVEELQALGRPSDAGHVALEYLSDVDSGVRLLTEAGAWSEALRIAYARERGELVNDVILGAAVTSARGHVADLQEGQEKVGKYLARFQAVRQRRLQLATRVGPTGAGDVIDEDGASVVSTAASTAMSGFSAYSHGTGGVESSVGTGGARKLSRKAKKKIQQGGGKIRAGSPEEESALVTHLAGLRASEPLKAELKQLAEVLVLLGEEPLARQLQSRFVTFERAQEKALEEARGAQAEDKAIAAEETEKRRAASRGAEASETGTRLVRRSFVGDHNYVKSHGRLEFRTKANGIHKESESGEMRTSNDGWEVLGG